MAKKPALVVERGHDVEPDDGDWWETDSGEETISPSPYDFISSLAEDLEIVSDLLCDANLEEAAEDLESFAQDLDYLKDSPHFQGELHDWSRRILACADAQRAFLEQGIPATGTTADQELQWPATRGKLVNALNEAAIEGNEASMYDLLIRYWFIQDEIEEAMYHCVSAAMSPECFRILTQLYRVLDIGPDATSPQLEEAIYGGLDRKHFCDHAVATVAAAIKDWPETALETKDGYPPLVIYAAWRGAPTALVYALLPNPIPSEWLTHDFCEECGDKSMSDAAFVRYLTAMPQLNDPNNPDPRAAAVAAAARNQQVLAQPRAQPSSDLVSQGMQCFETMLGRGERQVGPSRELARKLEARERKAVRRAEIEAEEQRRLRERVEQHRTAEIAKFFRGQLKALRSHFTGSSTVDEAELALDSMMELLRDKDTASDVSKAMRPGGGTYTEADLAADVSAALIATAPTAQVFLEVIHGVIGNELTLTCGSKFGDEALTSGKGVFNAVLEAKNYRLLESLLRYPGVDNVTLRYASQPLVSLLEHQGLRVETLQAALEAAQTSGLNFADEGPFALALAFNNSRLEIFEALIDPLLESGLNPLAPVAVSLKHQTTSTMAHMVVARAPSVDLLRRVLHAVQRAGAQEGLSTVRDGVHRRTLLQAALEAPAAPAGKAAAIMEAGVSLLPFRPDSPLIIALQKKWNGKEGVEVVQALLTGWGPAHPLNLLGPATAEHHDLLLKFLSEYEEETVHAVAETYEEQLALLQAAVDAASESPRLLDFLLERLAPRAQSAMALLNLHDAIATLTGPQVATLARAGAPISTRDGVPLAFRALETANFPALDALFEAGVSPMARDLEGNSLLHHAATLAVPAATRAAAMEAVVLRTPELVLSTNSAGKTPLQHTKIKKVQRVLRDWEERGPPGNVGVGLWAPKTDVVVKSAVSGGESGSGAVKEANAAQAAAAASATDLTLLGPLDESDARKRQRVKAMLSAMGPTLEGTSSRRVLETGDPGTAAFGAVALAASEAVLPCLEDLEHFYGPEDKDRPSSRGAATAAASDTATANADTDLAALLQGLPWELSITRDAYIEWSSMDRSYRDMVRLKLTEIAQGRWEAMGSCERRHGQGEGILPGMHLWRCKLTKQGRIIFDIAPDFSQRQGSYVDMVRIWCITLDHKRYEREMVKVIDSLTKALPVTAALRLRPTGVVAAVAASAGRAGLRSGKRDQQLPRSYVKEGDGGDEEGKKGARASTAGAPARTPAAAAAAADIIEQYPAANIGQGTYTPLKLYSLSAELARSILAGGAEAAEFPFRVSPEETRIIELEQQSAIILAGRSGTGKTTCAVFRLFSQWMTARGTGEAYAAVFVTASGTLRREVARSFAKTRRAVLPAGEADALDKLDKQPLHTLRNVPVERFPLFLSQKNFLEALDATLDTQFFLHRADGSIEWEQGCVFADPDGLAQEINLAPESDHEDSDEEVLIDDDVFGDARERAAARGAGAAAGGANGPAARRWQRQEMGGAEFVAKWTRIAPANVRGASGSGSSGAGRVPPALAWADIVSYIKGSAEAIRSAAGHLSEQEYLSIGKKRAPNFSVELRPLVFRVYEGYEQYKRRKSRYDAADVVAHLYSRLKAEGGYRGTPLNALYRDEVQDFMQGELLLDIKVVSNPNAIFYSGDTAQTIARGVGFRFEEIRSLFHAEAQLVVSERTRRLRGRAGGAVAAVGQGGSGGGGQVAMPSIEVLKVNYRTHSGILDAAAAVVDVLKHYFRDHVDDLERERAFFSGPPVLLAAASGATSADMARLLSWSDRGDSQVEFGAHQVVLVRSEEAKASLPKELQGATTLTVAQAKGLEFDDVLLYNFFTDSPASLRQWRALLNFLDEQEAAAAAGRPALPLPVSPEEAAAGVGVLGSGALRPLPSVDPDANRVLCDELKHLYVALTRAKNFVAVWDDNAAEKRAPFYYFLARLGLGRVVADVGAVEKRDLGLSKSESSAVDWAERGTQMMDLNMFEYAAMNFEKAGDAAMAQYCRAGAQMAAAAEQALEAPAAAHGLYLTAAVMFLDLVLHGERPQEVEEALRRKGHPDYGRRVWATKAADALVSAKQPASAAAVLVRLGRFKTARSMLLEAGDVTGAARACAAAASSLRARGKAADALDWAVAAFKLFQSKKNYLGCLKMLEFSDGVAEAVRCGARATAPASAAAGMDPVDEVCHHLMTSRANSDSSSDSAVVLAASKHLKDPAVRLRLLERAGLWAAAAALMPDTVAAAEVLAEHVGYAEAARRVLTGLQQQEGRESNVAVKEAELLSRYAVAAGDAALLVEVDAVLAQSDELCRGHSIMAARLTASILLRLAEALAGSEADKLSLCIQDGMSDRLSAFLGIWRGNNGAASADAALWPEAATLEDLEALDLRVKGVEADQRVQEGGAVAWLESGARGRPTAQSLALASLGLWCGASRGGGCALGILRCVNVLQKTSRNQVFQGGFFFHWGRCETVLDLPPAVLHALQAANSAIQWLSRRAGGHWKSKNKPSFDATSLIKELAELYALSGLEPELRGGGGGGSSSSDEVSWPSHDARFSDLLDRLRAFKAPGSNRRGAGISQAASHAAPAIEVLLALLWALNGLVTSAAMLMDTPMTSNEALTPTAATAEQMRAALAPSLQAMQLGDTLSEALGAAHKALPRASLKVLVPLEKQRGALWAAILSAAFPAAGATAECVQQICGGFSGDLKSFGVNEERLVACAAQQLAVKGSLKAAALTLRRPAAAFALWRSLTCLMPGNVRLRTNMLRSILQEAATCVFKAKDEAAEAQLLVRIRSAAANHHPAELLLEASEALSRGQAVKTIGCFSEYVSSCLAAPKKLSAFGYADVAASCELLPSENAVWVLEVATALAVLGCVPPAAGEASVMRGGAVSSRRVAFLLENGALQALAPSVGYRSPAVLAADVAASGTENRLNRALFKLSDAISGTAKQLAPLKGGKAAAVRAAVLLRRLALTAGTLAASVLIDQTATRPVIPRLIAERVAMAVRQTALAVEAAATIAVSFDCHTSLFILHTTAKLLASMGLACFPRDFMGPLRQLAVSAGTSLLLVSPSGHQVLEFDGFPSSGPLSSLATTHFRAQLSVMTHKGAEEGQRLQAPPGLELVGAAGGGGWGGADDFGEEEARRSAGRIILREWRRYRAAKARLRLRHSQVLRGWVTAAVERFRALKRAAEEQEAARSAMRDAQAALVASGAANWREAVAAVDWTGPALARYGYVLAALEQGYHAYPDGSCLVCPPDHPTAHSTAHTLHPHGPSHAPVDAFHAFMPHHHTAVMRFYAHSGWWQEQAASHVGESQRLEAALGYVAQRLPGYEMNAGWLRTRLDIARGELLGVLETVEALRDWGWHGGPQAAALLAALREACGQADGMLQEMDADLEAAAMAVAAEAEAEETAAAVAAADEDRASPSAAAGIAPDTLMDLGGEGDDHFMDDREIVEEEPWEVASQRKGKGRSGRGGGSGGKKGGR